MYYKVIPRSAILNIILFTLAVSAVSAQVNTNIGNNDFMLNWPEDAKKTFCHAVIKGDVPYIVVNDIRALYRVQSDFVTTQLNEMFGRGNPVTILRDQTTSAAGKNFEYYSGDYLMYKIAGEEDDLQRTTGFAPGDKFFIQAASEQGNGFSTSLTVQSFWFFSRFSSHGVVLECDPVAGLTQDRFPRQSTLIAYPYKPYSDLKSAEPVEVEVPQTVTERLEELKIEYVPEDFIQPDPVMGLLNKVTSTSFRILHNDGTDAIYHAGIVSYGMKAMQGRLYIFDSGGNLIQMKEYADELELYGYYVITGLTDVDKDGSHELVVTFGGYSGGIELLVPEFDENGNLRLVTKLRIWTKHS